MKSEGCQGMIWSGREALHLFAAGYEAIVVPSLGANVISLSTVIQGRTVDILRTPANAQTLLNDPYAYGIPILFPANRVAGGEYCWDGITYRFPRNYPNDVHIHGVLHNRQWPLESTGFSQGKAWARFTLDTEKDEALHSHFPLPMAIHLEISLSHQGLRHLFVVENKSKDKELPVGLAYHTAFRVDFCGKEQGVKLHVPILAHCTDDEINRLPNGKTEPLNDFERRMSSPDGCNPLEKMVDSLYTAIPGMPDAVLRDETNGCEVIYHAGGDHRYWIVWNQTTQERFIAVEPQTWLSNAMHCACPSDQGAIFILPGQSWSNSCNIYARPIKE